jgi:hypothetical protein
MEICWRWGRKGSFPAKGRLIRKSKCIASIEVSQSNSKIKFVNGAFVRETSRGVMSLGATPVNFRVESEQEYLTKKDVMDPTVTPEARGIDSVAKDGSLK